MDKHSIFNHMKAIHGLSKAVSRGTKNLIRTLGGNVDKEAHEGEPGAKYIAYSEELNHFLDLLMEVEQKLLVTKKTSARRKLERQKMLLQQEVHFYRTKQEETVKKEVERI